jgi:hypothetical protein
MNRKEPHRWTPENVYSSPWGTANRIAFRWICTPVKVVEPYQMLGEVKPDLMAALGVDVIGLGSSVTMFGFRNEGWKPWTTFDGTPVLVPEGFNTEPEANGDILMLHIQRIHPVHAHLVYP